MLTIANERAESATLIWQSPGFIGTNLFPDTGTDPVGGCATIRAVSRLVTTK